MLRRKALDAARRYAPARLKRLARAAFPRREEAAPVLARRGVIEDLCYWVADERLDTVLPLQNYFSVLFPDVATGTRGVLHLYGGDGRALGTRPFVLPAHGLVKLRASEVLRDLGARSVPRDGTLLCDITIPQAVLDLLDPAEPFYFWDRFYIAYQPAGGVPCFVHGVDKTFVADAGEPQLAPFYPAAKRYTWIPEIPVDLTLYARFSVILVNRTDAPAAVELTVKDGRDAARRWSARIAGRGAHRFTLGSRDLEGLDVRDLRLRLDGMPTRWGRPVVMKEFANGALSAMHC
jgi:hypothetical protein